MKFQTILVFLITDIQSCNQDVNLRWLNIDHIDDCVLCDERVKYLWFTFLSHTSFIRALVLVINKKCRQAGNVEYLGVKQSASICLAMLQIFTIHKVSFHKHYVHYGAKKVTIIWQSHPYVLVKHLIPDYNNLYSSGKALH